MFEIHTMLCNACTQYIALFYLCLYECMYVFALNKPIYL